MSKDRQESAVGTSHFGAAGPSGAHSGGLFAHHGVWAPGVRLFRTLQFHTKAAIVSATFLLPIALLALSLWGSTQDVIDFAVKERQGVVLMRALAPVFQSLLDVRNATRATLGGFDAKENYRAGRARTDAALAALQKTVQASGDPIGVREPVDKLVAAWRGTEQSANGADAQGRTVFGPVTEALMVLLTRVGDDSNLVLDPDVDSFYLINAMVLALPGAAEDVGQVWGWGSFALAKGGLGGQDAKRYYGWALNANTKLGEARAYFARSVTATPALKEQLDLTSIEAGLAFTKKAQGIVESGQGDAAALYAEGRSATLSLFKVYDSGFSALDGLLATRIGNAQQARNLRFLAVAVCLLAAAYLFYAFYLVTCGGLQEVRRHLEAMTHGDLTTHPRPWGKDEAAALMLSLLDMQTSLRTIVSRVRGSSESIVHASTEIASASMDLSARTEQTAANLEQSASSMDQIASTVKHTADNVRQAADVASRNSTAAGHGGSVIAEVVNTMEGINASSKQIGDIIGTIDGIAFQTNILALNAAVEAARAGEQGRGFAVVASEVRSLAQRSAEAAKQIKSLITTSVDRVEAGSRIVHGAGDTMHELVDNARRMNDLLNEISTAATEQSHGVAQVGTAVTDLDRMTQQNAALVEQTAAAASALKEQALVMADEVSKFRLPAEA